MKEALFYEKIDKGRVKCFLCPHRCIIPDSETGLCRVRRNVSGRLYSLVYAKPVALNVDPVEKKPLYHFLPGTSTYSIATLGCNFQCGFCQNWQISQAKHANIEFLPESEFLPEEIVAGALQSASESISYTYTEPTVFFEYVYDIARRAGENKLYNILVSNGYINPEPLKYIAEYLDAANIDLKSFKGSFYRKYCSGRLEPVLSTIEALKKMGVWVEITTLLIPSYNDSEKELRGIASFIAGIDPDIPWHISRFHPDYEFLKAEYTPLDKLNEAKGIGRECGLNYIYTGNVSEDSNTYCPSCGTKLIERGYFKVRNTHLEGNKCINCKKEIAGVFK